MTGVPHYWTQINLAWKIYTLNHLLLELCQALAVDVCCQGCHPSQQGHQRRMEHPPRLTITTSSAAKWEEDKAKGVHPGTPPPSLLLLATLQTPSCCSLGAYPAGQVPFSAQVQSAWCADAGLHGEQPLGFALGRKKLCLEFFRGAF